MKTVILPLAGMMVLGLAACGGGGNKAPVVGPIPSSGILELELPSEADRARLSTELNDAIDAIQLANEEGTAITPGADATYSGVFGLGVDDTYGTLVTGTMDASFTFASSDMDVTFTATDVDAEDPLLTVSGTFGATGMAVTDGLYSGTATGTLTASDGVNSEDVDINANLNGAITSAETFGSFDGLATYQDTTTDTFGGLFYGAQN